MKKKMRTKDQPANDFSRKLTECKLFKNFLIYNYDLKNSKDCLRKQGLNR